jgi:peroxiredoxin Q/BCP
MSSALPALGAKAPDFTLPRDGGATVTLSAFGGPVVLFFYPKANTPGCTLEARGFTTLLPDFLMAGAEVLGISRDSVKKQENFVAKQSLGVPLLSDEDGAVCNAYGVWGKKKMMGREYEGIIRSTFLIAADGTIARVWSPVKVKGHPEEVLDAVRAL